MEEKRDIHTAVTHEIKMCGFKESTSRVKFPTQEQQFPQNRAGTRTK
jgi:hypothetical protein